MTVERKLFYVASEPGPEADLKQVELALRTLAVPDGEADLFGIETFMHTYEPTAAYAWLREARNPMIAGKRALEYPFNPNAKRPHLIGGVAYPAGRTRLNKLRLLLAFGVTEGMDAGRARDVLSARARSNSMPEDLSDTETMLQLVPQSGNISLDLLAPEVPAEWERIAFVIDNLMPAQTQHDVASATFVSLEKFFRSINVSYNSILPIRQLCERLWGYYRESSDEYTRGIDRDVVKGGLAGYLPAPYVPGLWRVRGAANQQATWGNRAYGRTAGDVIFGTDDDFNCMTIGCRPEEPSTTFQTFNDCDRPTGESHRIWFQMNGRCAGGINPNLPPLNRADGFVDVKPVTSADGRFFMMSNGRYNWLTPVYLATSDPIRGVWRPSQCMKGRDRLWMTPPLEWYWRMYFAPQPEFGGKSFADWVLAMTPMQFVRDCRRSNTQKNSRLAGPYANALQTQAAALPGASAAASYADQLAQEKAKQGLMQTVGAAGTGIATATAAIPVAGPVVGLIVGAVTVTTVALMAALINTLPAYKIDVLGQIMPSFTPFGLFERKLDFATMHDQTVKMPAMPQLADHEPLVFLPGFTVLSKPKKPQQKTQPNAAIDLEGGMVNFRTPIGGNRALFDQPKEGKDVLGVAAIYSADVPFQAVNVYDQVLDNPAKNNEQQEDGTSGGMIALGVGVVALLGGGAYFVISRNRKKSNRRQHSARNRRRLS